MANLTGGETRDKRVLSVFNVVQFPNIACNSETTNRNGTCYTASECTAKGGSASGTCASSFGVCCIFEGSCGTSVSENNTYFTSSSMTTGSTCTYEVCKSSSDVCQLRLDFETFSLSNAVTVTTNFVPTAAATGRVSTLGQCQTDMFGVTSPGSPPIPIICGTNTGYHMYVPASDQCNTLSATFGTGSTATTSSLAVKVTQIECSSERRAPDGCLQYFTSETGTVDSFNYASGGAVHLSNQNYNTCIRQGRGQCAICYYAATTAFKLSNANGIAAIVGIGDSCGQYFPGNPAHTNGEGSFDHIIIAGGICGPTTAGTAATTVVSDKYCGSALECLQAAAVPAITGPPAVPAIAAIAGGNTVCTNVKPFKIGVEFDGTEAAFPATGENSALANSIGFRIEYWQRSDCVIRPA